jgi:broad specificity phosphatase PhoE
VLERLNGDPSVEVRLTNAGRVHARAIGEAVGPVDLAVHTAFGRTRETAELAWPDTPLLEVPELNEFGFGRFEGTRWTEGFDQWALTATPLDSVPGGGESRVAGVRRYVRGYRKLLERPEDSIGVVTHGAPVRYVLLALAGKQPMAVLETVELANPFLLEARELARAVDVLEEWLAAPAW